MENHYAAWGSALTSRRPHLLVAICLAWLLPQTCFAAQGILRGVKFFYSPSGKSDFVSPAFPGSTISIRQANEDGAPYTISMFGPSFGPQQSSFQANLDPNKYEVGVQVPDGYKLSYRMCNNCLSQTNGTFTPYGEFNSSPLLIDIASGQTLDLLLKFEPIDTIQVPMAPVGIFQSVPLKNIVNEAYVSQKLTCNVVGVPNPIPETDHQTFQKSDSDAGIRLGINRDLGGIITSLSLINAQDPNHPLQIIDARSAGGAAMQATIGIVNKTCPQGGACSSPATAFNQAAGNSAENWGFGSDWINGPNIGMAQKAWTPLYSNDVETGTGSGVVANQSPCYHSGMRFGNGRASHLPSYSTDTVSGRSVLHLASSYTYRTVGDQSWTSGSTEQAMYLLRSATRAASLRIYFVDQKDQKLLGPVTPYELFPKLPFTYDGGGASPINVVKVWCSSATRSQACNYYDSLDSKTPAASVPPQTFAELGFASNEVSTLNCSADLTAGCFFKTLPTKYAVMVWNVAGNDIAMAIHGTLDIAQSSTPTLISDHFSGVLNLREMVLCRLQNKDGSVNDKCGSVQWHSVFNLPDNYKLPNGHDIHEHLYYDVGTPEQISALIHYAIPPRSP